MKAMLKNNRSGLKLIGATSGADMSAQECAVEVLDAVPSIMEAIRANVRILDSTVMSLPQLRCLGMIDRNPGIGVAAIAVKVGVATPTTSAMVDRLVRANAVQSCADPADRRRMQLFITSVGHLQLHAARKSARDDVAKVLSDCSSQELQIIHKGLALLKNKICGVNLK
jgi:DNA-binding MarR family transcriptional regulator